MRAQKGGLTGNAELIETYCQILVADHLLGGLGFLQTQSDTFRFTSEHLGDEQASPAAGRVPSCRYNPHTTR